MAPRIAFALGLAVGLVACAEHAPTASDEPAASPEAPVGLSLALHQASDTGLTVDITYRRGAGQPGPRMAEIVLQLDENLTLEAAEPLEATTAAGKQLVAQAQGEREVRLLVFATGNVATLDSGGVARVRLRRTAPGPATVRIADRRPVFAPAESDRATPLGAPLTVEGP